jgi:hypothetical protein
MQHLKIVKVHEDLLKSLKNRRAEGATNRTIKNQEIAPSVNRQVTEDIFHFRVPFPRETLSPNDLGLLDLLFFLNDAKAYLRPFSAAWRRSKRC